MLQSTRRNSHVTQCGNFTFHNQYTDGGFEEEDLQPGMAVGSPCNHELGQISNAKLVQFNLPNERVEVQTIKGIEKGEELFMDFHKPYRKGGDVVEHEESRAAVENVVAPDWLRDMS